MGLRSECKDNSGDEAREFVRCGRRIARDTEIWLTMIEARRRGARSRPKISDPCRETVATKNAKAETIAFLSGQDGRAQIFVGSDRVYRRDHDQAGSRRFFLPASARSRLRRCNLTPKRVSIASRHCGVVTSGLLVLSSTMKARTSAEIL